VRDSFAASHQRELEGDRPGGDAGRDKDAPAGFFARLFSKKK
jgi:hypothetical protein